jgi:hypothetical protein
MAPIIIEIGSFGLLVQSTAQLSSFFTRFLFVEMCNNVSTNGYAHSSWILGTKKEQMIFSRTYLSFFRNMTTTLTDICPEHTGPQTISVIGKCTTRWFCTSTKVVTAKELA